jgi:hypothetical protein
LNRLNVEGMLGGVLGYAQHFYQTPHKYVLIALQEVDELAFLFGVQAGPDLDGLGRVFSINLHGLSILDHFKNTR